MTFFFFFSGIICFFFLYYRDPGPLYVYVYWLSVFLGFLLFVVVICSLFDV